jgi:UDP-N-acetylmuramoylalanine--D-glutamate ligase
MFLLTGPLLIIGRAKSGESVAKLLKKSYPQSEILFYDDRAELSDFKDSGEVLKRKWAHVVLSPGFPFKPWLKQLQDAGAVFTQELDVAAAYLGDERIYAITGSVGKSTCSWVAKQTLEKIGKKVFLGGNFGIPLADYALKKISETNFQAADIIILELSSYQIERMAFMVDRGLILNFLPNHLDRYSELHAYYQSKLRLMDFCREGIWGINPGGDLNNFTKHRGVESKFKWVNPQQFEQLFSRARLMGAHNRANLAAVLELIASPELEEASVMDALLSAEPLPHRIEFFEHNGMHFVNDSKATTIESILTAYAALKERYENQKIFWLLGGKDKKLPWRRLKRLWSDRLLNFVFFGECAGLAKSETGFEGVICPRLSEALAQIKAKITTGDVVVLSPGGTSLDEFKNFEERGEFFKSTILSKF